MTTPAKPELDLTALRAKAEAARKSDNAYDGEGGFDKFASWDMKMKTFHDALTPSVALALLDRLESAETTAFNEGVEAAAALCLVSIGSAMNATVS